MSEHEGGESKSVGAFLLGFLTGVLVCLGVGGGFFLFAERHSSLREHRRAEEAMMAAEEARLEAMMMRDQAEKERLRADEARKQAEAAERKARKAP